MKIRRQIPEPSGPEEAVEIQSTHAREVHLGQGFHLVAGVDVAYSRNDERAYVAACTLSTSNWSVVHEQRRVLPVARRYESGFLGFREGPLVLEALLQLPSEPDLILVDGNGIAHPRKFGLACHVGVALDHPTIGVAKTWPRGCVQIQAEIGEPRRGTKVAILHEKSKEPVGWQLVTQAEVDFVYVSPGHRVGLEDAATLVLKCSPWYRLPEPLRAAHRVAQEMRVREEGS